MFIKKLGVQIGKKMVLPESNPATQKTQLIHQPRGRFVDMHKDGFYFMCSSEKNWGSVESNWDLTDH
jgi:hypothetical protein